MLDTQEKLNQVTNRQVPQLAKLAAQFAGHMALRLVHDHILRMDLMKYDKLIRTDVVLINTKFKAIRRVSRIELYQQLGVVASVWMFMPCN